jgi:hypothetical protein
MTLPRMNAHRLVIIAAALTTLVAAAPGTTFAVFSGQALPRAVRHTLAGASGTALDLSGAVNAGQAAQYTALLRRRLSADLAGARSPSTRPGGPTRSGSRPTDRG